MALHRGRLPALVVSCALAWAGPSWARPAGDTLHASLGKLADLTLEELGNIVVESVSRRAESLLRAPASIYVITGDEIRRGGVTTLPGALRLAPNLQVAAIDARQYAISARGFNGNVANKLLVMVDGRTVYSPLFSGVFWDAQDFVAADIDRIEVISGPAGVTWGTNAVNGVINVVTHAAGRTQGPSVSTTLGTLEKTVAARYGFMLGEDLAVRAHVKTFERDASELRGGGGMDDAARGVSLGVRADWAEGSDEVSVIAGLHEGDTESRPTYGAVRLSGANLTARWSRDLGGDASVDVKAYADRMKRKDAFLLQEEAEVFDLEAKYRRTLGRHRWLLGAGYRQARDRSAPGLLFALVPPQREQEWHSAFLQDEIALSERLALTLGARVERNPYSGWEMLPSIRLGHALKPDAFVWAALSRAVRSPARFDREIVTPAQPPYFIVGGPNFGPEIANVAELGYRMQLPGASFSITAFVQDYDRLRSGELLGQTVAIENRIEGPVRGIEAWGSWQPMPGWRLDAGLLWLDKDLRLEPGSLDPIGPSNLGNDPSHQWSLRSLHTVRQDLDLSVAVRHVGRLPSPEIPSYTAVDLTLNWAARDDLRLSFGVRNALDPGHVEYQGFSSFSEIPRSAFVALAYQPR